jgi:YidC/Oxa1 family membrane protein insertase
MQEFAPEMQKLKAKYGNDKQKLAAEMQKLQSQQGVNPLGRLPAGAGAGAGVHRLFHVLREFEPGKTENYIFGAARSSRSTRPACSGRSSVPG